MSTGRIYARPASEGTATVWRFCLPKDLKFHALNNLLLKHLTEILIPLIKIIAGWLKEGWPILQPHQVGCGNQTSWGQWWHHPSHYLTQSGPSTRGTLSLKWPLTMLPIPSPGTMTEQKMNSPKSFTPTAPLSFHSTSKLFRCQGIVSWLFLHLLLLPVK